MTYSRAFFNSTPQFYLPFSFILPIEHLEYVEKDL
jgi:hypothetical protein